jgi:hypothetical protein
MAGILIADLLEDDTAIVSDVLLEIAAAVIAAIVVGWGIPAIAIAPAATTMTPAVAGYYPGGRKRRSAVVRP